MKECSAKDCHRKRYARGLCEKHWDRKCAGRHPEWRSKYEKTLDERLGEKVELIPFSTCHWWTGSLNHNGYGQIKANGVNTRAHRVAYRLFVGPIPIGLQILHSCDNRSCVNPDHLFIGTNADNNRDMCKKGRQPKGEGHGSAKLSESEVKKIRSMYGDQSCTELAIIFGVSRPSISKIVNRQVWVHI